MQLLDTLDRAVDGFGARLRSVDASDWSAPTPCDGWDVRYLCAHVVGGNRFAALVLGGASAEEAMHEVLARTHLGDDPMGDLTASAAEQRAAFGADGALRREIDHPIGPITAGHFLELRVLDVGLHTWDLARAIGADEALDADLVSRLLDIVGAGPPGMGFGMQPLGRVGPDGSAQDRLLDLAGRDGPGHHL